VSARCVIQQCGRTAKKHGLCWGHEKALRWGRSVVQPLGERIDGKGPKVEWARMEAAVLRLSIRLVKRDAGTADLLGARHAFRQAMHRYFSSRSRATVERRIKGSA
jgi:hypothetical protein